MADRNDDRGWRGERRSFRDNGRYGSVRGGHGEGEGEPWRRDRYGSRFHQDRTNYGAGYDSTHGDYGRGFDHGPGPADFHPDHEFEPDYLHWRDEQLRLHDRDYAEWRAHQHRSYDEDYRRFREHRRENFGQTFETWRAQRNLSTGLHPEYITPESHDYGRHTGAGFGQAADRPSGSLEPPGAMTGRPAPGMASSDHGAGASGGGGGASTGPLSSPQVQATTDGWDTRKDATEFEADRREHRERQEHRDQREH